MASPVRVAFLGGLGEIGRNCATIEQDGRIVVLDCGVLFPNPDMPGVDLVLPDLSYLAERRDSIDGIVLSHGHEDHIGGLGYLLGQVGRVAAPVYGSALTLGLARARVEEAGISGATYVTVADGERREIGPFSVEFIPVTHSVPHGFATAFHTSQGVVLHTGDFKIDHTPVDGRRTDLSRIGTLASDPGIALLLSDSTNADEAGFTDSESSIGASLRSILAAHRQSRVIVSCFASHVHRIQQLADAAIAAGRSIALIGRSMLRNVALARELGLLTIPESALVDLDGIDRLAPGEVCVISTGSQGEPMSALALLASGENRRLDLREGDVVVLSSHAIPGNEWAVGRVIDGLARRGAEVIHSGIAHVHESGHAKRGELETMLGLAKPAHFVPVHGEYRHLLAHAHLAITMGVAARNVLVCEDGDSVELSDEGLDYGPEVPAGHVYVDGVVGDVGHTVLRDRRTLAAEGVVVVVIAIDSHTGTILTGPEIVTRGWVDAPDSDELIDEARRAADDAVKLAVSVGTWDLETLRRDVRRAVGKIVADRTRRRPIILPVLMEG